VSDLVSGANDFQPGQYGYQLQTSTLVGSGELPTGDRYQVRGYVNSNGGPDTGCVAIVWENSDSSLPECSNVSPPWGEEGLSMPVVGRLPGDDAVPGSKGVVVMGAAPEQSTEVQIRVPASQDVDAGQTAAQLFPVDGSISDTTGTIAKVPPVKVFVGYLPPRAGDFRSAPPAQAVALDGDQELGSTKLAWLRFKPPGSGESRISVCESGDPFCEQMLSLESQAGSAAKG
jgi:hypothetical protein